VLDRLGTKNRAQGIGEMVKVFITVDTEVWPQGTRWPHVPLPPDNYCERELDCYFWGGEAGTKLGLRFQLETLRAHDLRATFFVDPLFSFALGLAPLTKVVQAIRGARQEIALHLHPEWLTDSRVSNLPSFAGPLMRDYSEATQSILIGAGLERLGEAGAAPARAFRAGSWGADTATLRAVARNGIHFDSSLNACWGASFPDLPNRDRILQPRVIEGVWEFPMTYFVDRPMRRRRPLQLCACSVSEFRHVLEEAHNRGWASVVIVTHSFEFVRTDRLELAGALVGPRRLVGSRFRGLCEYLARHRDRFETTHFCDVSPSALPAACDEQPRVSSTPRTLARWASQALSLIY
jgi:hypothetical protein